MPKAKTHSGASKRFRVTVLDTGMVADFTYRAGAFRPLWNTAGQADLRFAAPLSAYLQMVSRQEDPDTLFFNRRLSMEGDTELGLIVKNSIDALELPVLDLQQWTPDKVLARFLPGKRRAAPVHGTVEKE